MKFLLDTHVVLWWLEDDPKLGAQARNIIPDDSKRIYISAASIWEASVKEAKGKLRLGSNFDIRLAAQAFLPLPITHLHARKGAALPPIHKDPFDRLLVAQCMLESMTLITQDKLLAHYGIPLIEA